MSAQRLWRHRTAYICINFGGAVCPQEIETQLICIEADIGKVLQDLLKQPFFLAPVQHLPTHALTVDFLPLCVVQPWNTQRIPATSRLDWRKIPSPTRVLCDTEQSLTDGFRDIEGRLFFENCIFLQRMTKEKIQTKNYVTVCFLCDILEMGDSLSQIGA